MNKTKKLNHWRLNVVITQYNRNNLIFSRDHVIEFLKKLASIYLIDYSICLDYKFPINNELLESSEKNTVIDIVYFRSNNNSMIQLKAFRKITHALFDESSITNFDGVEVFTQIQKALVSFPFPNNFYRPLKYPYIEFHQGEEIELEVYPDALKMISNNNKFNNYGKS